jgi:hypothetical protein
MCPVRSVTYVSGRSKAAPPFDQAPRFGNQMIEVAVGKIVDFVELVQ